MRFYEYEAREIVKRAGIPVTDFGFVTDAEAAREIAQRIGGPVVIKSQVLTGGRMKAGGVQFADTPDEAATHAEHVLNLPINGHDPRGVMVDTKANFVVGMPARRTISRDSYSKKRIEPRNPTDESLHGAAQGERRRYSTSSRPIAASKRGPSWRPHPSRS